MADTWHYPHLREAFQEFLRKCRKQPVVVVGHARPDADCIGSQAALVRVLREAGGEASALNESQIPFRLEFLTEGIPYRSEAAALPEGALVVTVDCSDTARAGIRLNLQDHQVGANFDHHLSNQEFGDQAFVVKNATSTAELLGGLLRDAGMPINRETATALYAGIITDAGNFCYPSTTPEVLEMAAYLIRQGAQPAQISQAIYERETFAKIRLLKIFLERMTLFADSRACYSWLTEEDFTTTGATYQDTEGLVNHARAIEGVRIAAYLEVKKDQVKGSLRSRDESNRVDLLAGRFGGGGHACAAGFVWSGTLESLLPEFKAALIEFSNPSFLSHG